MPAPSSPALAGGRRHAFLRSARYEEVSRSLPLNAERAKVVQALIDASGVLDDAFDVFEVVPASSRTMQLFHSRGFVDALQTPGNARLREQYGLIDDCGPFSGVFELAALEAGGSVQAAQLLAGGGYDTAIWWGGGRHHAKTDAAAGFCYVNDVVLAIFELLRTFERVMYIDIDVHHGDGVEEAFCYSDQVLTCSFHHHAPLFFPGSGSLEDQAGAGGKRHIINVPLHAGCSDETFLKVYSHTIRGAAASFVPSVILLQCGADALVGDPLGEFNLTVKSYTGSLEEVRRALPGVPVLLLGGGGYSQYNVARAWATLTYVAAEMTVPDMVPEHEFFEEYSPGYSFALRCSYRPDRNLPAYIQHLCSTIDGALSCIRGSQKSHADSASQDVREKEEQREDEEKEEEEEEGEEAAAAATTTSDGGPSLAAGVQKNGRRRQEEEEEEAAEAEPEPEPVAPPNSVEGEEGLFIAEAGVRRGEVEAGRCSDGEVSTDMELPHSESPSSNSGGGGGEGVIKSKRSERAGGAEHGTGSGLGGEGGALMDDGGGGQKRKWEVVMEGAAETLQRGLVVEEAVSLL